MKSLMKSMCVYMYIRVFINEHRLQLCGFLIKMDDVDSFFRFLERGIYYFCYKTFGKHQDRRSKLDIWQTDVPFSFCFGNSFKELNHVSVNLTLFDFFLMHLFLSIVYWNRFYENMKLFVYSLTDAPNWFVNWF